MKKAHQRPVKKKYSKPTQQLIKTSYTPSIHTASKFTTQRGQKGPARTQSSTLPRRVQVLKTYSLPDR